MYIKEFLIGSYLWKGSYVYVLTAVLCFRQGRRNDVKARGGADFRERALLSWYILRDVCKTSGVELRLIMFSIYWMIGVWRGSPPGDCAILEARWLHFLRFLKQIRKRIRQGHLLNWKGTFAPLAPPGKGQWGRLPLLPPSSGVPGFRNL
jgi:hypothetical protein